MSKVDDEAAPASSEPSTGGNVVTDDDIILWKAMFASSNPKREEGVLDKYNFIAVVLKVGEAIFTGLTLSHQCAHIRKERTHKAMISYTPISCFEI